MIEKETKNLILFYIIAFAFSWALWIPQALNDNGILKINSIILSLSNFGAYGPLIAALALTYYNDGKNGLIKLLKRVINFKFNYKWYLIIFLTFPIILGASLLLAGVSFNQIFLETNLIIIFIGFFVIFFIAGPLQEELGWRGYALDRFQKKWNALISSIIVGFLWGLWHLPLFYMFREDSYYTGPIWGLIISTILISILFTWIYNNTGRSIMAVLLFHTMWNFSNWIFPTITNDSAALFMIILLSIMIIFILFYYGPKHLIQFSKKLNSN